MCARVIMASYHHNPYRQSSALYTRQQLLSSRVQEQQRTTTRTAAQHPLRPLAPETADATERIASWGLSGVTGGASFHLIQNATCTAAARGASCVDAEAHASGLTPADPCTDTGNVVTRATTTLKASVMEEAVSNRASTASRVQPTPSSTQLDDVISKKSLQTSPLHTRHFQQLQHSGDVGSDSVSANGVTHDPLPSDSTPTLSSQALLPTRSSLSSTTLVDQRSFFDSCGAAVQESHCLSSCLSISDCSLPNVTLNRRQRPSTATAPTSPENAGFTTLFIGGLPAFIVNKWQLQPHVPPHGLIELRCKSSRGRYVGFAVYDSPAAASEALQWFAQMRLIKEMVQVPACDVPPPPSPADVLSGSNEGQFCLPVRSGSPVLRYEDYLFVQQASDQLASLVRSCTLLQVDWARSWAGQHPHAEVVSVAPLHPRAHRFIDSTPFSNPPSVRSAVPHIGREANHEGGDGYSHAPQGARRVSPSQVPSLHRPLPSPPLAFSLACESFKQPPPPGIDVWCTDTEMKKHPAPRSVISPTRQTTSTPASLDKLGLPAPEQHHRFCAGITTAAVSQDTKSTYYQASLLTTARSRAREGDNALELVGAGRSDHPEAPLFAFHQGEQSPSQLQPQRRVSYPHHQRAEEPPLPSRTLFVRLIRNFDTPEFLQPTAWRNRAANTIPGSAQLSAKISVVGGRSMLAASNIIPGLRVTSLACGGVVTPLAPSPFLSQTVPPVDALSTYAVMPVRNVASTESLSSVLLYHSHPYVCYRSTTWASPIAALQPRGSLAGREPEEYFPRPPISLNPRCTGLEPRSEADVRPRITAEDLEQFHFAQSVLREGFFSERFAGFLRFREFLRPPFYGGCFVFFERGEDMQRCLQWMRRDAQIMRLFAVMPARNDTFGQ